MGRKILFISNLGSPENPEPSAVGKYLREFLMDPRVLDIPTLLRFFLVHFVIVPFRKFRSSNAYQKVWTAEGSPLVVTTKRFAEKLSAELLGQYEVVWGMRYSEPSLARVVKESLQDLKEGDEIYFVPLYPQYATSATESSLDEIKRVLKPQSQRGVKTYYLKSFFDQTRFIQCVAGQIQTTRKSFVPDYILFSYHGLPERHLTKLPGGESCEFGKCCETQRFENRNCYRAQAFRTTQLLVHALGLKSHEYGISFQSRLGRIPWIQPFTDVRLLELASQGVRRIAVVCPSFVTDCLETLEEIKIGAKEYFIADGGESLELVPCLNDSDEWVGEFGKMIQNSVSWQTL